MSSHQTVTMSCRVVGGAALLAVTLLLTGCAGSTKSTSAAAANTTHAVGATSSSGTAAGGTSSGGSTSVTSSGTTASATSASAPSLDTSGSFCDVARRVQKSESDSSGAFTGTDPTSLKTLEEQAVSELPVFVAKAPAQLKGAVQEIASAEEAFYNQLKAANFNIASIGSSFATTFSSPAFAQASTAIEAYFTNTCGINVSDASTG